MPDPYEGLNVPEAAIARSVEALLKVIEEKEGRPLTDEEENFVLAGFAAGVIFIKTAQEQKHASV